MKSLEEFKEEEVKAKLRVLEVVRGIVGNDVVQVFGDSGTGKTSFCLHLLREALELKKKVVFIDAERNLVEVPREVVYFYEPRPEKMLNIVKNLPKADLVILDSLGFPVLQRYSEADTYTKGQMLLTSVTLAGYLKIHTHDHNSLAIVTNQPVSPFGGKQEGELRPFGDKARYAFKEIWKSELLHTSPHKTECIIRAYRSRRYGRGRELFKLTITDEGVTVKPVV